MKDFEIVYPVVTVHVFRLIIMWPSRHHDWRDYSRELRKMFKTVFRDLEKKTWKFRSFLLLISVDRVEKYTETRQTNIYVLQEYKVCTWLVKATDYKKKCFYLKTSVVSTICKFLLPYRSCKFRTEYLLTLVYESVSPNITIWIPSKEWQTVSDANKNL
jgi:hypothetical protein